jgi:hypothetical protein
VITRSLLVLLANAVEFGVCDVDRPVISGHCDEGTLNLLSAVPSRTAHARPMNCVQRRRMYLLTSVVRLHLTLSMAAQCLLFPTSMPEQTKLKGTVHVPDDIESDYLKTYNYFWGA